MGRLRLRLTPPCSTAAESSPPPTLAVSTTPLVSTTLVSTTLVSTTPTSPTPASTATTMASVRLRLSPSTMATAESTTATTVLLPTPTVASGPMAVSTAGPTGKRRQELRVNKLIDEWDLTDRRFDQDN